MPVGYLPFYTKKQEADLRSEAAMWSPKAFGNAIYHWSDLFWNIFYSQVARVLPLSKRNQLFEFIHLLK